MRDELILALDLYVREGPNPGIDAATELSETLRAIPVEPHLAAEPSFRSPQSVKYKLQNFVAVDPGMPTAGFSHGGQGDALVWSEFADDPAHLHQVAQAIRVNLTALTPLEVEESEASVTEAEEGAVLTGVHRKRERSAKLRKAKKASVLEATGRLACEACDTDFGERYGPHAAGFIECHHIRPVHTLKPGQKTQLADLALLCSNCHRVLHLRAPWLTVAEVKSLFQGNGSQAS